MHFKLYLSVQSYIRSFNTFKQNFRVPHFIPIEFKTRILPLIVLNKRL